MKGKKLLVPILIFLIVAGLSFTASAADLAYDLSYTMEASASVVKAGETFTVEISISENNGFLAALADVTYDPSQVTYVDASFSGSAFTEDKSSVNQPNTGALKVLIGNLLEALFSPSPVTYTATGKVATLTFQVVDGYEGNVNIGLSVDPGFVASPSKTFDYVTNGDSLSLTAIDAQNHQHTEKILPAEPAECE